MRRWCWPFGPRTRPEREGGTDDGDAPLVIEYTCGRLRLARHLAIAAVGAFGAWLWFGAAGLLPTLLWAWHCQPRRGRVVRATLGPIRAVQLGALRTVIEIGWCDRIEVFRDELTPAALAALRRSLKARCSAGDGSEHVEPV